MPGWNQASGRASSSKCGTQIASDGGVFTYGDAHFYGSTGNITLSKLIVWIGAGVGLIGYWLVATDGGIFTFPPHA